MAVCETEGFESAVRPEKEMLKRMDGVSVVAVVDDFQMSKKWGSKVVEKIAKVAAYRQREGRKV